MHNHDGNGSAAGFSPRNRELRMPIPKCPRCGSELIAPGALHGPGRSSFRPEGAKFFTMTTGDVMTKASMCHECGLVQITGDVNKLRRLTSGTVGPGERTT